MAAVLVTLEKSAKGGMQKFFKYVPAVVLCYLIAMFLCTLGVWDMAETKPITFQSLILLLGSVFLVSAIATNIGNKLYALTNFSDKATWTVLFVTVVALIAAVTPLGTVAGSGEVSSLLLYAVIGLLASRSMNVNELAEALSMPVSTAALNVRQLEEAGLISTEIQPGIRGAMKLCSRRIDSVSLHLVPDMQDGVSALTLKLPLGSYACAREIRPECGLVSEHAWIGESNAPRTFYHPDRFAAQLMWFESGEVEYRFSLGEIAPKQVEWLEISMEISSNAPMYREDFKSDIYVGLGTRELGVWTSPGDYGARRGRFNPSWWSDTSSQYGLLKTWRIDSLGCTLDGEPLSSVTVADLQLDALEYIPLRIGIHADAAHVGGINLFGEKFGDFAQGLVVRVGYAKAD